MELPYKLHLGAGCISRPDFLRHLARAREHTPACSPETARVWVPQLLASTESAPPPPAPPPPAPPPPSASHSPRATRDPRPGPQPSLQPGPQPRVLDLDLDLDPSPTPPPELPAKGGDSRLLDRAAKPAKQARHAKHLADEAPPDLDLQRDLAPPQPLRPTHCWAEAHLTPVLATGA